MAEEHGYINRKEYYYVIKAFQDIDDPNKIHYLFDHDTCLARFPEGIVWNNKTGQWQNLSNDGDDFDTAVCDDIWEKLDMLETAKKYIWEINQASQNVIIEAIKEGVENATKANEEN